MHSTTADTDPLDRLVELLTASSERLDIAVQAALAGSPAWRTTLSVARAEAVAALAQFDAYLEDTGHAV